MDDMSEQEVPSSESPTREDEIINNASAAREKQGDKRKAPERSFGLELSRELPAESPNKKPRIQIGFIPSKTPVMSPLCADDESPSKYLQPVDNPDIGEDAEGLHVSNIIVDGTQQMELSLDVSNVEEIITTTEIVVEPEPTEPSLEVEVEQEEDYESDPNGDRFFTLIREKEELQQRLKEEQQSAGKSPPFLLPEPVIEKVEEGEANGSGLDKNGKGKKSSRKESKQVAKGKKNQSQRKKTDHKVSQNDTSSSLSSAENSLSPTRPVSFSIQIFDDTETPHLIYETRDGRIKSDFSTMMTFLKDHKVELPILPSTGYSADVSSPESLTFDFLNIPQRQRMTSLGSTIPRPSDASSISRPSIVGDGKPVAKSPGRPRKAGDIGPILSSTRIGGHKLPKTGTGSASGSVPKAKHELNKARTPVTNGGGHNHTPKATEPVGKGRGRGRKGHSNVGTSIPKGEGTPGKTPKVEEANTSFNSTTNVSTSTTSTSVSDIADPEIMKRIKQEPEDKPQAHSSRARKAFGVGKEVLEKFSDPEYVKSASLWGAIGDGEPVFARWRDKNYYSGRIVKKALNDTWSIHFEDDMEDVASETHILPVKILGIGTRGVYCPPDIFKPEEAIVVGQKLADPIEKVEYAIISEVDGRRINCFRKNLILKEADAKDLRKQYQIPTSTIFKTVEINLDNIVTGPRRRVGTGTLAPSDQIRKLIADAFDASSADEQLLKPWTPTAKKVAGQGGRRTSAASGTESNASDDTRLFIDVKNVTVDTPGSASTGTSSSSPATTVSTPTTAAKDTPKSVSKDSPKKSGKTKERPLFYGMQFFLTASGGGDPSSSGASGPLVSYDKDEYRDTIENKGGIVANLVGRESFKANVQTFLISDSHARTVKYIYCLAAGIPCVSSLWIGECLTKNTIVDWKPYELNSGWSLEEGAVIPAHQRKPLKDIRIFVTAESEELYNYWKPVLIAAQANLLKPLKPRKKPAMVPPETEILVTDATCTPEILEIAQEKGIAVVKPEWLVQTIIMGHKAEFAGHEKYQVGMSDAELGEEEEEENDENEENEENEH